MHTHKPWAYTCVKGFFLGSLFMRGLIVHVLKNFFLLCGFYLERVSHLNYFSCIKGTLP